MPLGVGADEGETLGDPDCEAVIDGVLAGDADVDGVPDSDADTDGVRDSDADTDGVRDPVSVGVRVTEGVPLPLCEPLPDGLGVAHWLGLCVVVGVLVTVPDGVPLALGEPEGLPVWLGVGEQASLRAVTATPP